MAKEPTKPKVTYTTTVCKRFPERCEPRKIEMVCFDADDTMWSIEPYGIASNIRGPFKKIDEDTLEVEERKPPEKAPPKASPKPSPPPKMKPLGERRWLPKYDAWYEEVTPGKWEPVPPREAPPPPSHPEKESTSATGEEELYNIAEELWESLPEEDQRFLETTTEVTGEQMKLIPLAAPTKKRWWKPGPPAPPAYPTYVGYERGPTRITLMPTFRETLDKLRDKGIACSIISLNTPGSVKDIVEAFGLSDKFVEIQDTWKNKADVFEEIVKTHKVNPCGALFVDNMLGHVEDVSKKCALGLQFGKGKDVEEIAEILNYIEGNHG